jgi:hypothetical protein
MKVFETLKVVYNIHLPYLFIVYTLFVGCFANYKEFKELQRTF